MGGAVPEGNQIVVVVDGLDEASDWKPGPDLFPLDPPRGVKVIATARYLLGDRDANDWIERLGWGSAGLAAPFDLKPLDRAGIADVLRVSGLRTMEEGLDLVEQLFYLTSGDPLLNGLYASSCRRNTLLAHA